MIRTLLQRIYANISANIYVVIGEQIRAFDEPAYSTHPDTFGFPFEATEVQVESPSVFPPDPFELPVGTEREIGPSVIKVFSDAEYAINFAYCCNLASVAPSVFERLNEEWVFAKNQSALDIDW